MFKSRIILVAATIMAAQFAFADDAPGGKECGMVAKACQKAGYTRNGGTGKQFWMDCMKPVLLGKTVANVTVDAATAKTCRDKKVEELKQDLQTFQNAS